MPQAIPAAVSAVAGFFASTAFAIGSVAVTWGTVLQTTVALASLAIGNSRKGSFDVSQPGINIGIRIDPSEARSVVYGRYALSGSRAFAGLSNSNQTLHQVLTLSDGEIDAIESIKMDETTVTVDGSGNVQQSPWGSNMRLRFALGTDSQTADSTLVAASSEWTTAHRGRGVAAVYWDNDFDADKYAGGLPTPLFQLRGAKVYDPRLDTTRGGSGSQRWDDRTTWAWSENPALCALHYIIGLTINGSKVFGMHAPEELIDFDSFSAAATACDATVDGSPRYTCGGIITSQDNPMAVLRAFGLAMGGYVFQRGGKIAALAGVAQAASTTLTDDDVVGDVELVGQRPYREAVNTLRVSFTDPDRDWRPNQTAPITDSAFVTEDGGEVFEDEHRVSLCNDDEVATRLGRLEISNRREPRVVRARFKPKALNVLEGDAVTWDSDRFGVDEKMIVLERSLNPDGTVGLTLRTETDAKYTASDAFTQAMPTVARAPIYDPATVPTPSSGDWSASGVSISDGNSSVPAVRIAGGITNRIVRSVVVEYRTTGGSDWTEWTEAPIGAAIDFDISAVSPNTGYDISLRYRNAAGALSDRLTLTATTPTEHNAIAAGDAIAGSALETSLTNAVSDNVITPAEKRSTIPAIEALISERTGLVARASAVSVSSTAYTTAHDTWTTYLATLTTPTAWDSLSGNTTVVGSTFVTNWQALIETRDALADAIEDAVNPRVVAGLDSGGDVARPIPEPIKTSSDILSRSGGGTFTGDLTATFGADWSTTVTSRPSELTDGRIAAGLNASGVLQTSIPSATQIPALSTAKITSGTFADARIAQTNVTQHEGAVNALNLTNAPAEAGATLGADWSANVNNIPTNLNALVGTEVINNASITVDVSGVLQGIGTAGVTVDNTEVTIASNGTLSGGGGGQVTIGGLGYTGDLNATFGADWAAGEVQNRPTELTDGRITTALDSFGVLQTNISGAQVASGTVAAARIDNLPASQITSGTFANARIASSNVTQHQASLSLGGGQITSGTVAAARIDSLPASQITSGTFANARIASSNVTQHEGSINALNLTNAPADALATAGADWATNVASRPTELTDGRITTAIATGGKVLVDGYEVNKFFSGSPSALTSITDANSTGIVLARVDLDDVRAINLWSLLGSDIVFGTHQTGTMGPGESAFFELEVWYTGPDGSPVSTGGNFGSVGVTAYQVAATGVLDWSITLSNTGSIVIKSEIISGNPSITNDGLNDEIGLQNIKFPATDLGASHVYLVGRWIGTDASSSTGIALRFTTGTTLAVTNLINRSTS